MNLRALTIEQALYGLVVALALALRLAGLGATPLSDGEASTALVALAIARGDPTTLGPQPGYELITGALFYLLETTPALARLLPALAGGLLVVLPYAHRDRLGKPAALVLAVALAFDPGLVSVSRTAGGGMLALSFGLIALSLWLSQRPVAAGVMGGLALLSGPSILAGGLGLSLAWLAGRWLARRDSLGAATTQPVEKQAPFWESNSLRTGIISGGGTLLLAGTLFLRFPEGLGALAGALPAYLRGWVAPSGVPALRLPLALGVYQPLALVFGLLAARQAWKRRDSVRVTLLFWFLAALGLAMLYSGRQVVDLVWAVVPLWALAAIALSRSLAAPHQDLFVTAGLAGVVLVLLSFSWLNLAGLERVVPGTTAYYLRLLVIGAAIGLAVLTAALVSMGWSRRAASSGLAWGVVAAGALYVLSLTWAAVGQDTARAQSWWFQEPATVQADLLVDTVGDLSEWQTGRREALKLALLIDSPSLAWTLREFSQLQQLDQLPLVSPPPVVITRQGGGGLLPEIYRGTDLAYWETPVWQGVLPEGWLRWLVFQEAETEKQAVSVWARSDLFVETSLSPLPAEDLEPSAPLPESP